MPRRSLMFGGSKYWNQQKTGHHPSILTFLVVWLSSRSIWFIESTPTFALTGPPRFPNAETWWPTSRAGESLGFRLAETKCFSLLITPCNLTFLYIIAISKQFCQMFRYYKLVFWRPRVLDCISAWLTGPCVTPLFAFRTVVFRLGGQRVTGKEWERGGDQRKIKTMIYVEKINKTDFFDSVLLIFFIIICSNFFLIILFLLLFY